MTDNMDFGADGVSDYRSDWQAEQFKDECERLRQTIEALEAAEKAGTPREALETLAYEAGVAEQYRKQHP